MSAARADGGVARKGARGKRIAVALAALGGLGALAIVFLAVAAALPTDLAKLSAEHAPIEDRASRVERPGCGLLETKGEGGACTALPKVGAVREEEVSFASSIPEKGLATLKGTLSIPDGGLARPAIILVHGSGPNSRNEVAPGDLVSKVDPPIAVFEQLASFFAHEGLVVLRYDKRNCLRCYPEFDVAKLGLFRWPDLERDARDAFAYLRTRPEVDAGALVVAGHSEGGQIAPFVAVGEKGVVAVMMLAGLTETFAEGLLAQLDRFADARLGQADFLGSFNTKLARRNFAKCTDKLNGEYNPKEECLGGGVTLEMLADYNDYVAKMPGVLASEPGPVFAIQGSVDRNIDPVEMSKLSKLLAGRDHELHYVPKVNHLLVNVVDKTPGIDAEVLRHMHTFLVSVKVPS